MIEQRIVKTFDTLYYNRMKKLEICIEENIYNYAILFL